MSITFPTSDFAGLPVEEINTEKLLRHAAAQARERNYANLFIVDVDSHHYENYSIRDIVEYMDDPVLKQLGKSAVVRGGGLHPNLIPSGTGFQDMGGRISRLTLMATEKTPAERQRDAVYARRWMDSMGVDVAVSFPTPMLTLNTHPQLEMQTRMAWAYNRWLVERVLPEEPRLRGMLYLPMHNPEEAVKIVRTLGEKPGVAGFMVSAVHNIPIYDNVYMRLYAEIEERGQPIGFHGGFDWKENAFRSANKFITIHALGFCFHNILHVSNWIMNGMPERFPKLKVIWIESGLAWIPWIMQRLDNEYMMRSNEVPALKMLPSDYMRRMYYTSQPMEQVRNRKALEVTFEMMNASSQLLFSSDYPHWDFDLPSTIYDLPFVSDEAKRNILGGTAAKLFNIDTSTKLAQIPPAA